MTPIPPANVEQLAEPERDGSGRAIPVVDSVRR